MALLRTIGNIQAWILLTVFYVVIVTPIGFIFRFAADPLRLRRSFDSPRTFGFAKRSRGGRSGFRPTGSAREAPRDSTWQPFARQYGRIEEALEQS